LARNSNFEEVVRLLWNQDAAREIPKTPSPAACRRAVVHVRPLPVMARLRAILPFAAVDDPAAFDLRPEAVSTTGWRILHLLTAAVSLKSDDASSSIAARLARGWNVRQRRECRLLEMALILCADHELNVSAFAARVVASTGSSPYDVVGAGLAALRGPRHGGHTARVEQLLDEASTPRGVRRVIADYVRRGEAPPGFGPPLYPEGDPRAKAIFSAVEDQWPSSVSAAFVRAGTSAGRA